MKNFWIIDEPELVIRIRLKNSSIPIVFIITLVWFLIAPTNVSSMVLAALGGLLFAAYLWAHEMAIHVRAKRNLQYAAFQVGDELEEQISLENNSFFPALWVEFEDSSNIPGYEISDIRSAGSFQTLHWHANTLCSKRGVFKLGPWVLRIGDPFGIFTVEQKYRQFETIIVYPSLAIIPQTLFQQNRSSGDHRQMREPIQSDTLNVATTRPYFPGDPLHRIHWRSTAKRDKPFIKTFDPEASSEFWLLPDLDATVHVGKGADSSLETTITLTASLAAQLLQQHLSVGILAFPEQPQPPVVPQKGYSYLWTILRALAPLEPNQHQSLAESIDQATNVLSGSDLLIVITPSLDLSWGKSLQRLALSRKTNNVQAILIDPASFLINGQDNEQSPGASRLVENLMQMGIYSYCIRKDEVKPIKASLGAIRRWEFTSIGTGKVIVRQTPRIAEIDSLPNYYSRER